MEKRTWEKDPPEGRSAALLRKVCGGSAGLGLWLGGTFAHTNESFSLPGGM